MFFADPAFVVRSTLIENKALVPNLTIILHQNLAVTPSSGVRQTFAINLRFILVVCYHWCSNVSTLTQ